MESIKVRIRHLLFAHHEELITDDECQDELAILRHRGELAMSSATSVLGNDRGTG